MSLEAEIRAVIKELPQEEQDMIYAVFGTISNVCALADRVGGPDKQYGSTAVALLGARYQDMIDAAG